MKEGDSSNNMYWLQSGTMRLFKKKGNGYIELGVVHSGEVIGEMSFLDNQPRSASVEALQTCEVIEIPRGNFEEFLATQPSWMKSLVQTLVTRLRTTNNRLRELESASTISAVNDEGKTTKVHEFLSTHDVMKLCSTLLLVSSRNGEKQADASLKVKAGWFQLYGNHIFGQPLAKIQAFLDTAQEVGLIKIDRHKDHVDLFIYDPSKVEQFVHWMHEENAKTEDKKLSTSSKGIAILDAIREFSDISQASGETFSVDMEQVFQKAVVAKNLKYPFDLNGFDELVKDELSSEVRVSGNEKIAQINLPRFKKLYPMLLFRQRFRDLNAQKRNETTS